MLITTFRDLLAWQKAHTLAVRTYRLTEEFPRHELFGLTSQMRRAAVSVPSNIAEGFKRRTNNDSLHFYNIADCSLEELKYQFLLARDLKYLSESSYAEINDLAEEVGRLLNGWKKWHK